MDSKLTISLLYDFYGELLQPSQQRVVELYVNDDLSLSEAADILDISRQGVRDSFNRAVKKLREYESKLGLMQAHADRRGRCERIRADVQQLRKITDDSEAHSLLSEIENLLERED